MSSAPCPLCGGSLKQVDPWEFLTCEACQVLVDGELVEPIEVRITNLFVQLSPTQQVDLFCQLAKLCDQE